MSSHTQILRREQAVQIEGEHPTSLHYYEWWRAGERSTEEPEPRAVLQIAHGMVEHAGRYDSFARFLVSHGYAVVAADHRGHGLSARPGAELGYFGAGVTWETVVEDLHAVRAHASTRFPDRPYAMFGHSMGSFLTRHYIALHGDKLAGTALSGTGEWPGLTGQAGLALARLVAAVAPAARGTLLEMLAFGPYEKPFEGTTHVDWLSRNTENVQAYIADPLCGYTASNAFFVELLRGLRIINTSERAFQVPAGLPILIASGELDPVGGARAVENIARKYREAGAQQVSTLIYPEDRHEILNEVDRERVWRDILAWLDQITSVSTQPEQRD